MLHAALASMIMYYQERTNAGEMHDVRKLMIRALMDERCTDLTVNDGSPHCTYLRWGRILRAHFDAANLHLVHKQADNGSMQV